MSRQVLEGTWDELAERADELRRYKKLRLVIDSDDGAANGSSTPDLSLAERFAGRVGRCSFEPTDLSERTGDIYADLLANRYAQEQQG